MKKILINKRKLVTTTFQKLKFNIHNTHVASVISLFINEFMNELESKNSLNIYNFCSFSLEKTKPRKFHHIQSRKIMLSSGKTLLKIRLAKSLRRQIIKHLDISKTFI